MQLKTSARSGIEGPKNLGDESEVGRKERDVTEVTSLLLKTRHHGLRRDQNRFCECEDLL